MSDQQSHYHDTTRKRTFTDEERALSQYISDTPALLSLLYDTDLLPEQTEDMRDFGRTMLIAAYWRKESAEVRERDRKAFKAGYVAASSTPDCNAFDRIQREAVAAAREYTEGEKETGK